VYVDLWNDESESKNKGEMKKTNENLAFVPKQVEIICMISVQSVR